jgi:lactate permease
MSMLYSLLSFLPILLLFSISLWKGVRPGVYAAFLFTTGLFFLWGKNALAFLASVFSALIGTINILMIIFGAVFLYQIMEQKGYIKGIKESLSEIHPDKKFRFFFLAFFLTAFFESVAGFGTPLAIVPILLMSIGFSPMLSISVVLLIDGLFSLAGAVGTPVHAGLEIPLHLTPESVSAIYLFSTILIFFAGLVIVFFIARFVKEDTRSVRSQLKTALTLYTIVMVPFVLCSFYLRELAGLVASIVLAAVSYLFLFKNKKVLWKPWLPYWVLVLLLLIPKVFSEFESVAMSYKLQFSSIYGTDVSASLQPFKSPLIPFLITSLFALYHSKSFTINLKPVISKTYTVFLILFPSLAITQLMMNSGGELPSMIEMLSGFFVKSGDAYPILSPFIGVLGTFISGSTTVSNILFGAVQQTSAIQLGFPETILLALQLTGASLGNAVCLFNIIAAAAVTGSSDYGQVLKRNILPILLAAFVCSLIGYGMIYIFY